MSEQIQPDDLQMCRSAQQQAVRAEQEMLRAKQIFEQAHQAFIAAMGAYRFSASVALERKGFPPTAGFNLETGEISNGNGNGHVSMPPPAPPADENPGRTIREIGRRKKGA